MSETEPVGNPIPVITIRTPITRSTIARWRFVRANNPEGGSLIGRPTGPVLFKGNTSRTL